MRLSILSSVTAVALASSVFATVSTTLVADSYIVKDGSGASAKFYSVLDVYVKGDHVGDTMSSVLGHSNHAVVIKTSQATAGGDIFQQGGSAGNGWLPTDSGAKRWDSFIAAGNRAQGTNARVTNRAGTVIDYGASGSWTGGSGFTQKDVAGSNFIDQGTTSGWYSSKGANPYSGAGAAENPFARVSLYNSTWNATYSDLYRGAEVLSAKGIMQNGALSAAAAALNKVNASTTDVQVEGASDLSGTGGASLDFHWMIGRFAIEVTGKTAAETITMQVQFNMVGKNGVTAESGTSPSFTGSSSPTSPYNVSNHFAFAVPSPSVGVMVALAGFLRRRRNA
jgi:hypothetical protein